VGYYKAVIAYDGTDFLGFQIQAQGRTVQGTLEAALHTLAKQPVRVTGAGRTDTGVHATGQVIGWQLPWQHSTVDLLKAFNANLPQDVAVKELTTTEPGFHPRFSAVSRQYRYTILNQPIRNVLKRQYTALVTQPLSIEAMQAASRCLLGEHDFAAFGRPPQGDNSVRTVTQAVWSRQGPEIYFDITANAFLYRMVRNIVGALIQVGQVSLPQEAMEEVMLSGKRSNAIAPAPPNGLCLIKVNY
jgi:tRNA pseudouridine38-40 synthase